MVLDNAGNVYVAGRVTVSAVTGNNGTDIGRGNGSAGIGGRAASAGGRDDDTEHLAQLSDLLGEEAFHEAFQAGKSLDLESAVRSAIQ